MGGLFSRDQAIVIPLPGNESTIVNRTVATTNSLLELIRNIGCTPKLIHNKHSLIFIFMCAVYRELQITAERVTTNMSGSDMDER